MAERTTIVTGSKGGVGTTTVSLNLAVQLALQTKKRTALIDLARPFGQVSLMLDFEPRFTVLDALERIERIDESVLTSLATRHKSGVEILAGPLQAPMKPEQRQSVTIQSIARLIALAGQAYDFVVVDIGVVNAADWALVLQQARTILLVSEPGALSLGMIERHMAAAARAGVECGRIHLIMNRSPQKRRRYRRGFRKEFRPRDSGPASQRLPATHRSRAAGHAADGQRKQSADRALPRPGGASLSRSERFLVPGNNRRQERILTAASRASVATGSSLGS